jgi:hypothetical protein
MISCFDLPSAAANSSRRLFSSSVSLSVIAMRSTVPL